MHATSLVAALVVVPSLFAQAPPALARSFEDRLPASTYAAVAFGGTTACRDAAMALPIAEVLQTFMQNAPPAARARFEERMDFAARQVQRRLQGLPVSTDDLRAVAGRPMLLAVGRLSIEGLGPSVALLIDEGDAGPQVQRCANAAIQLVAQMTRGTMLPIAKIDGVTVQELRLPEGPTIFTASVGGAFVLTNSRGYLRELAAVAAGTQPGLARESALAALQTQLPADALASLFVNTASVCRALAPHMPYESDAWADALGVGEVDGVYAATTAGDGSGTDLLHVGLHGSASGLLKALVASPCDVSLARACSNDTVLFAAASVDAGACVKALERVASLLPGGIGDELKREMENELDQPLGDGQTARGVMNAFGTQVGAALMLAPGATPKPELLARIAVRDANAVGALLQRLEALSSERGGIAWKTRKSGEHEIRYCNVPIEDARLQVSPSWLLHQDALWLASDPAALIRALRQLDDDTTSLAAQADFRAMAGGTQAACGLLHVRSFRAVEIGWRTVETLAFPMLDANAERIGFGSDALPDSEELARALGTSTFSYRVDDRGITCKSAGTFTLGAWIAGIGAATDEVLRRAGAKVY